MDTSKWQWFRLNDKRLFVIKKGKRLTKADMINGNIRYIGAIESNNGVSERIANDEHLHPSNTITVSYNGSVAEAFYQSKEYWATDDVNVLYPTFQLNEYIAHFITTIIKREKYRYNYGRKWDKELMEKSQIKLPVDISGNPDWQYMESFVKEIIIPKLPERARSVWENKPNTAPAIPKTIKLSDRIWEWFELGSIIEEPTKGVAYSDYELNECRAKDSNRINYITRTNSNNGCKSIVLNENYLGIEKGNAITIGDTTATIYYQSLPFICGDHMVIIRAPWLNIYTGTFIVSILKKEAYRYNYGRAFIIEKIKKTLIKLPVDNSGNPDWQFMEDYIKSLPYSANI